ncbi:CHEK1 [Bugula neritina]|uniref:non-specific serine/threonine protein kinase n=1 Tax=Bugula neritina TaxID=10212 RepID=A0A7J7JZR0_BUGNE|nr:CHEK1 [Bugula neritina]
MAFIEGWNFVSDLGEGAYGKVRLAVNEATNTAVAVKVIKLKDDEKSRNDAIRKELCLQKMCNHDNIIRVYGQRQDEVAIYLLLEYAPGGELYDRIEPDVGMDIKSAHRLFRQLIEAVEYMFSRGIAHRDIKPENILLDEFDNIKVTDFGMATMFKHRGKERLLNRCCGTYPYIAPEVLSGQLHRAAPTDIWSCEEFAEYKNWVENRTDLSPFTKLDVLSLSLLKRILAADPESRFTIDNIKEHRWFKQDFDASVHLPALNGRCSPESKRPRVSHERTEEPVMSHSSEVLKSYSQPNPNRDRSDGDSVLNIPLEGQQYCFSQPIDIDNMLLSQIPCTQGSASQTTMQRMVKRMTRYYVLGEREQVVSDLHRACMQLGYSHKKHDGFTFNISTTDRRNMDLVFKVTLLDLDGLLLDFRLSKGDGIEFKKCFMKLKNQLDYLICHSREPPMFSQSHQHS